MAKRVFLVVLDSFGTGNAPDAEAFGDEGSNTLAAVLSDSDKPLPNLSRMGLFDIDGLYDEREISYLKSNKDRPAPIGSYGIIREVSSGKDSTIGHWEMGGIMSAVPQPTYPDGFPEEILGKLREVSGRDILCNKPYSGTDVIRDYGAEHMNTGALIVYTSADSVLQIAAHEEVVPLEELYDICRKTRAFMTGEHAVGRIIARPFIGTPEEGFTRTSNRHDFTAPAPSSNVMEILRGYGFECISVGKINDLFAGAGVTEAIPTSGNTDGIGKLIDVMDREFTGLCFVNLVDFDMKYGHRNDVKGYAAAIHEWDDALGTILQKLRKDDLLIITADHGCDPSTSSTDHSRETIPLLICGEGYEVPHNMGELMGFGVISHIVMKALMKRDLPRTFKAMPEPDTDNIMSYVDLTNLKVTATSQDIKDLIDRAAASGCASVCIPPCYVREACAYADGRIRICTVIGFPNGYSTTAVKLYEASDAVDAGASEIDMVINICDVKNGRYDAVGHEIRLIAEAVHAKGAILKVIIENCYLTDSEKIRMCGIVTEAGADYIKTSTGFGTSGATVEDVKLMSVHTGDGVRVKAAGGIRSEESARQMIDAGASRIGASKL
ncbi:deoxyribose-phosphate aldolase/phosphopentomutase,TIGR01696 [Ruminococcaceae bacterium YRB3002]|nr:deoxyribose-phosphate aldolase/phosphopentomutase,TIGR01696 [Ruminococcaceae bacterium YRB3002]